MDGAIFRGGQKFENLQIQLSIAATQGKDIIQQYSEQSKSAILQAWNSSYPTVVKERARELWKIFLDFSRHVKQQALSNLDPEKLYYNLVQAFWRKWTKRDVCFLAFGFACGSLVGIVITLTIKKKETVVRYMQSVQCANQLGIECAGVVENAIAPDHCSNNEVIINVKAVSVQPIDARICSGYGRTIGSVLRRLYGNSVHKHSLPITLGRDCTGIVVDIGPGVKRFEIGDEVWVTVPFWAQGTMCQTYLAQEYRVGRKPKNIGFEGAASVPYAGILALQALKKAQLDQNNSANKRVLIVGGCTPVGCILLQLLKLWKVNITTTCYKRAVPVAKALGADEVVVCPEPPEDDSLNAFLKELELKEEFDRVILTRDFGLNLHSVQGLCNFQVVSTLILPCMYDGYGVMGGWIVGGYLRAKFLLERLLGVVLNDFDEAHMCYATLDELAEMVETGELQTVVDKVLQPQDIEIALHHIESRESIGSTVITFR